MRLITFCNHTLCWYDDKAYHFETLNQNEKIFSSQETLEDNLSNEALKIEFGDAKVFKTL